MENINTGIMVQEMGRLTCGILFLILSLSGCVQPDLQDLTRVQEVDFSGNPGYTKEIRIDNNTGKTVHFTFDLNNHFPESLSEIKQEILESDSLHDLPLTAYNYVKSRLVFNDPYTAEHWINTPVLMFNSTGMGICDDFSAVLVQLWNSLGYESRIWHLIGHTVPEVRVNGHWSMYDPTFVFYARQKDGTVLGVDELSRNPDVFNQADADFGFLYFAEIESRAYPDWFITRDNNFVGYWLRPTFKPSIFINTLPSGASFCFPVDFNGLKMEKTRPDGYARLTIRNDEKVKISHSLIPVYVQGNGIISINTINYKLPDDEAEVNSFLARSKTFVDQITIESVVDSIDLYYLVNLANLLLEEKNHFELKSDAVDNLSIRISPEQKLQSLIRWNDFDYLIPGLKERYFAYKSLHGKKEASPLSTINDYVNELRSDSLAYGFKEPEIRNIESRLTGISQIDSTCVSTLLHIINCMPKRMVAASIINETDSARLVSVVRAINQRASTQRKSDRL